MTTPSTPHDKMTGTAAGVLGSMQDAAHEAQPAMERLTHGLCDHLGDMAQQSRDATANAQKLLTHKTRKVSSTAEHYIHCAPFKSVLIAAGVGAAAATLASWLMRSRPH